MLGFVFGAVGDFVIGAGAMWVWCERREWYTGAWTWVKEKVDYLRD